MTPVSLLLALLLVITMLNANAAPTLALSEINQGEINLAPWLVVNQSRADNLTDIQMQAESAWRPLQHSDTHRFGAKNLWLKFEVDSQETDQYRILTLDNPLLDRVQLYHLINGELVQQLEMGDRFPFHQRPLQSTMFLYPIKFLAGEIHSFYLQIDSSGSVHLNLLLQTAENLAQTTESNTLLYGLQMGGLTAIGLFTLFIALTSRSYSYGYYAGYVLTMTLLVASLHGFAFRYFWPNTPEIQRYIIPLLLPLVMGFALMFTEKVLYLKRHSLGLFKLSRVAVAMAILLGFLSPILSYDLAIDIDIAFVLFTSLLLMFIAVKLAVQKQPLAKLYIVGWSAMLLGASIGCLLYLEIIRSSIIKPQTAIMLGLTFEVIFMAAVLVIRYNQERIAKQEMQRKAIVQAEKLRQSREEALQAKAQANEQLEHMVQARTLELEITLRELNEANQKLVEQATVDGLTQVKNRAAFDKRLMAEGRISRRQQTPVAILMLDIDKFKAINDGFGHLAGDEILRKIADLLRSQLKRPSDLLSRFGGEEFAIILPNTSAEGALHLAELIRRAVETLKIKWKQQDIPLTISIGVSAAIIETDDQPITLVEQADKALYQAKNQGRNRACLYRS